MSSPLLIVGSVAIDTIKTPQAEASDQLGGSAVFAALTAKHFGELLVLSAIGRDFPAALLERLENAKIDLTHLTKSKDTFSFRWTGVYDGNLGTRETIGLELGVMASEKLQVPDLKNIKFAMMGNYHPARELEVIPHLPKDCFIASDTIHAWIKYERAALTELFKRSTMVTIDRDELLMFTEVQDELIGVKMLFALGPQWVIIKYGKRGSRLYCPDGWAHAMGIYDNVPKDTTGAGDTYLASIVAHLSEMGKVNFETIIEGMRLGTAAASITVEEFGVEALIKASKAEILHRAQKISPFVQTSVAQKV